jgi:hypothetical protein
MFYETNNSDAVAIRLPKALILNQKSWKKWIQWAMATEFTEKFANKQVAAFISALGPNAIDVFDSL